MDPQKITQLAKLLKNEGDKVLNSEYKLTLSGSLLRALNDSFTLIVDTRETLFGFQVIKPNDAKSGVWRDLEFIYDFVQKTVILCLTRFEDDETEGQVSWIDIQRFCNIRTLELRRVEVGKVVGLQQFRAHLQHLICVRSLTNLSDVIISCGGDKTGGFIWNNLRSVDFSYNSLRHIDDAFEFTPYIETLNLSHNRLVDIDALRWLPNLKKLDLSYNQLVKIPFFHQDATRRLRTLLLGNNFIEDISDISYLEDLVEVDLSGNCLLDHGSLLPLSSLVALQVLDLKENPLACHPKHRQATARYLHKSTANVKFSLDGIELNKFEKSQVGNYDNYLPILKPRKSECTMIRSMQSSASGCNTPIGSITSYSTFDNRSLADQMSVSMMSAGRRVKAREAQIADEKTDELNPPVLKRPSLEYNTEHLDIKRQIEELREQHGSEWLQAQGGEQVKSVVGFEQKNQREATKQFIEDLLSNDLPPTTQTSSLKEFDEQYMGGCSTPNEAVTEYDSAEETVSSFYQTAATSTVLCDTSIQSEPEDDEVIYAVINDVTKEDLLLVISDRNIRERDVLDGHTITKWSLNALESCERLKSDIITLNFDTMKRDKRRRDYQIELDECQKLESLLRDILSKRLLSLKLYRCAVCNVQFSREQKVQSKEATCPDCKSSYVVEITETPKKYSPELKIEVELPKLYKSDSQSSIAQLTVDTSSLSSGDKKAEALRSAGSANDSSSCSKISHSESSLDSTQSIAGSALSTRDTDFQGNESDIEILSNPSQSSIEVLDSQFSSRKHSEERRAEELMCRSVEATTQTSHTMAPRHSKSAQQLTESSSSGESIRTAYEQNHNNDEQAMATTPTNGGKEVRTKKPDLSVIGTMLGNLLHFANKSRAEQSEPDAPFEPYTYHYDDFSNVDHRLKLFLCANIFDDDGEMLKWIVKGRIYDENTTELSLQGFTGFFAMSTTKFYFLKATRSECDDPSAWLKRFSSGTQDRIITIRVLPFKMGITITIKGIGNIHFLLQDIARTGSLLLFFADHALPSTCSLEYRVSEDLLQKLTAMTNQEKINILSFVNAVTVTPGEQTIKCVAFIVTDRKLYITTDNFKWLCVSETTIPVAYEQQIENLSIEVNTSGDSSFRLHFKDELHDTEEVWQLYFDTSDACYCNFDTISQSWEKLYGVPLTKITTNL